MSVLSKYRNCDLNRCSPVQKSYDLVRDFVDGREVKSFVETDFPKIIESHGSASDWSLDSLTKAGINPNFSIHTSAPGARTDVAAQVEALSSSLDNLLNSEPNSNPKTE